MIAGIGTDIIEIERIGRACAKPSFAAKIFTKSELDQCVGAESLAGRFAAKEAVAKALGSGFSRFGPTEVEIVSDKLGKPSAKLLGEAKSLAESLGVTVTHVSISHCREYATAFAVAEIL
jgi:holo-[acyl-carrier protein] synthase